MMRDDFCAFILTHGRPDKVITYNTLKKAGYTGKIYIVIDDEDKTADRYHEKYGDKVLQFCKSEVAARIDEGDNFNDRRAIIYARNACFDLAKQVGCKYFIELDDDYDWFKFRFSRHGIQVRKTLDEILTVLLDYFLTIPALSIAMSQSGDHMGNNPKTSHPWRAFRKAMNSFICSVDRPFQFSGRINEDVNTYTAQSRQGELFLTILPIQLNQLQTQHNSGGMTEMYLDAGTYVKSFYTVMYCPSSVQIGVLKDPQSDCGRLHHKINWHKTAPKILSEQYKKTGKTAELINE